VKKIGLISLALVLAVGGLGIGYAAWTDTITIEGEVNTGDVNLDIVGLSSTWVYKVPGAEPEIVVNHALIPGIHATTDPNPPANGILVASATADIVSLTNYADNIVTVTLDNLFPSADFKVDFLIHYAGSIPARIKMGTPGSEDDITFTGTDEAFFNALWPTVYGLDPYNKYPNDPEVAFYGEMWESDEFGNKVTNIPDLEGYQLHECDYILVVITLHLPQDTPMNASAEFTAEIEAVQWNEY